MSDVHVSKIIVVNDGYTDERYLLWETGKFATPLAILLPDHARELSADIDRALNLPRPELPKQKAGRK